MTPQHYVDAIAIPMLPRVHNPWSQVCMWDDLLSGPEERKERLRSHLDCDPALIIVGNSARYNESRYTGIPFTSEKMILDGLIPRVQLCEGTSRLSKKPAPFEDKTSEIVWGSLYDHGVANTTVLFSAVPWHPEGEKPCGSDRIPTYREVQLGRIYLQTLVNMYPNAHVASIGGIAEASLEDLGIAHQKLRDPHRYGFQDLKDSLKDLAI